MRTFGRYVAFTFSSTFYTGFLWGNLTGKPGKGGGTAGAIVALCFQFALLASGWEWPLAICLGSFALGLLCIDVAEKFIVEKWGKQPRHTGEMVAHDLNATNIDEVHGQMLAGLPVWFMGGETNIRVIALIAAFYVFRLFDSKKWWPVKQVEQRFKGGAFGVMIDDTVAGIPGAITAAIILFALG